ncbi:MAG: RrF2 family transcriptional regulator, partial [Methylocystis sp.]
MLTKKAKYALKATAYLAGLPLDVLVSGKEIAEMQNIPKKFLDAILIELKNHGLIYS